MGSTPHHRHLVTTKLISRLIYILLPLLLLLLLLYLNLNQPIKPQLKTNPTLLPIKRTQSQTPDCNYTDGRWVPSSRGPLYNGTTCGTIKDGQNCMAHGRPDTAYLHYRWRPRRCNLPQLRPLAFLSLIRNKHLAFIGDSMARNQLESLLCLLSSAGGSYEPTLVYHSDDVDRKFRRWVFSSHNATVSLFWSPFLVNGVEKSASAGMTHNRLHLDSADERWASEIRNLDVVVFAVGHWFLHPAIYHEKENVIIGCHHCPGLNHTEVGFFDVFRKAMRTTLGEVKRRWREDNNYNNNNKLVVVTTFSPSHFEGEWDKAGACMKREPYKEGEKELGYTEAEMRRIQVEEVAAMKEDVRGGTGVKIEALDVTRMALMRPDGHPGPYMYANPFAEGPKERVQNDCVHWCLPGPIDAWNEILFQMVRRWNKNKEII